MTGPRTTDVKITSFFIRRGEPDYGESEVESNHFASQKRVPNGTIVPPSPRCRVNRALEPAEQRQDLRVAERHDLCRQHAGDAFDRVDPVITVREPGPCEAAGRTPFGGSLENR